MYLLRTFQPSAGIVGDQIYSFGLRLLWGNYHRLSTDICYFDEHNTAQQAQNHIGPTRSTSSWTERLYCSTSPILLASSPIRSEIRASLNDAELFRDHLGEPGEESTSQHVSAWKRFDGLAEDEADFDHLLPGHSMPECGPHLGWAYPSLAVYLLSFRHLIVFASHCSS